MKIQTEFEGGYDPEVVKRNMAAAKKVIAVIAELQRAQRSINCSGHGMQAVYAIEKGNRAVKKCFLFLKNNPQLKVIPYCGGDTISATVFVESLKRLDGIGATFAVSKKVSSLLGFLINARGYDFDTKLIKLDRDYS